MGLYQDIVEVIGDCRLFGDVGDRFHVQRSDVGEVFKVIDHDGTVIARVIPWDHQVDEPAPAFAFNDFNDFRREVQAALEHKRADA